MKSELERMKEERDQLAARLMALESVLATNEHLLLKAPALSVQSVRLRPEWAEGGAPAIEEWRIRVHVMRYCLTGRFAGHASGFDLEDWLPRVDTSGDPLRIVLIGTDRR